MEKSKNNFTQQAKIQNKPPIIYNTTTIYIAYLIIGYYIDNFSNVVYAFVKSL